MIITCKQKRKDFYDDIDNLGEKKNSILFAAVPLYSCMRIGDTKLAELSKELKQRSGKRIKKTKKRTNTKIEQFLYDYEKITARITP